MAQQEAPTLKWGDIIRIHGVNLSKKDNEKTKGLIVSKGFTDPNIYYQKYDNFQKVNLYRQSLFQIVPRSNFDMHDQLLQGNLSPHQKEQLKIRAVNQVIGLENSLRAKAGKQIMYGSQVIFKHVQSQSYLRGILKAADTGEGAFKIQVTENLSSQLIFRITSHRSYQHENDKIYYDDALQIYHPKADCFMNFSEFNIPIYLDIDEDLNPVPPGHPFYSFAAERPSIKKPEDKRIPIVNENKSKCLWKFIQHCSYDEYNSKNKIKSHDIVYFKHTKAGGLVSSTLAKPTKYYLKQKGSGLYYECFWQLIPKQVNELGPQQCNSFWVKNVVTGQFLEYDGFRIQIQPQNFENQSNGLDNQGLINLICSQQIDGQTLKLQRGDLIPIPEGVPHIIQKFESKFEKVGFIAVPKMAKDIFKIYKVDQKTLLDLQYALSSHQPLVKLIQVLASGLINQDDKDFKYRDFFLSLNQDYLNNIITILKMLIGKIYHTPYQQILTSGNPPNKTLQKILVQTGIIQLIIQIINLLYKSFYTIQHNKQITDDRAIRNKISQIFEYSYRLLQKTAVNNEDNRIYISRWVDLFLIHSNNINQSYIQECLVGILQNNQESIQAEINMGKINQLIQSFFKEAEQVSADTFLTTKYLRLFSTFIVCQNRVIKQNQNIILNNFFTNSDNQQIFRVKIDMKSEYQDDPSDPYNKIRSKQVLIAFGKQQYTTIPKFFRDWTSKWNYFIAYINLLADICMDRNNEAIKNVSSLLSLQMVVVILFDPEIEKLNKQIHEANLQSLEKNNQLKYPVANVHQPFIRIAHYLYINNDKFDPVKRIKRISRWYRNQEVQGQVYEDINKTKRVFENEKEEEQKRYLKSILAYIKQYLSNATQQPSQLSMLYTILDLLKTTIVLGLWSSITQFRQLIPLIVMRITKIQKQKFFQKRDERYITIQNIKANKQLLQMNRPQISKCIDCKIKATEIFKEINQFQIDIRLRYIMNFFKGLYQTTEDFNVYDLPIVDPDVQGASQLDKERNQLAKQEFFKCDKKAILGQGVKKVSQDQDIILKTNVWLSKLKQMTPFTFKPNSDRVKDRYLFQGGVLAQIQNKNDEDSVKKALDIHFQNIILALLEIPIYHNERLLSSGLKMLRTIFEQRKDLIKNFQTLLICSKGNLQQVYLTLKFMRNKFQMLTNLNIDKYNGNEDSSFSYALWKPYFFIRFQDKRSGIIQDLFFLSRTLKDNISLKNIEELMRVEEDAFDPNQVYTFIDERQKNNPLFQALNIAQGIYIPLLEYVRIMKDKKIQIGSIHYKLLRSIFQYLTQVCFNNLQAKQLMIEYVPDVLPHLANKVGASYFLYIVCYNNKILISNQELVNLIIESALNACVAREQINIYKALLNQYGKQQMKISKDYDKSEIFYALRGICLFNDQGYHRNQQLLMNKLQDNKYRSLIYQQIPEYKSKTDNFEINSDQCYVAAHFEMLSSLVESGNMINIGKLENIHPYTYCLDCLKSSNRWQIRRALRTYINRLYYVNKEKDVFLFEQFIRKQFDILNLQLHDIVYLYRNKSVKTDTYIKNGIRFKYAQSEIMLEIIQILITLHEVLLKSQFRRVLHRQLVKEEKYAQSSRPLHEKLIKLYRNLGCLNKIFPQTKVISPYIRQVSSLMKQVLENLQARYIEKKTEPEGFTENEKLEVDEIGGETQKKTYVYDYSKSFFRNLANMIRDVKSKQKLQKLREQYKKRQSRSEHETQKQMKQRCLANIFSVPNEPKLFPVHEKRKRKQPLYMNSYLQTTSSRAFKVLAKPQISENQQNIELNNRLGMVKKMMEQSPYFQKFTEEEHFIFVNILSRIDETSKRFYSSEWQRLQQQPMPVISMKQIISITFNLMMNSTGLVKDEEKIFVIKLIRCYITEAIEEKQSYKLPVDKWDADYCKEDKDQNGQDRNQFTKRQQLIEECGGSDFLIFVLSEEIGTRIQLLNEALLFGIAFLFNGNSVCQNSILKSLKSDKDNRMLLNIRKLIKKIGDFLIQVRANREKDSRRNFSYNIVDTFDFFSLEEYALTKQFGHNSGDKYQIATEINNQLALCRIFRFLQLFCENNNIDMKRFLSTQINDDDGKKTNSVNFIEEACLLLRKLFKIMNNKVVSIPNNLLAFIGEITQLPCLDNQISLIKSTFFEDISYMATYFEEPNSKKNRLFKQVAEDDDDPLNKLLEIYQQGVMLALSNFEGNDAVIMSEFMNKCHPRYLWIVMRNNIWFLLKQKYAGEQFMSQQEDNKLAIRETLRKFDANAIQKVIDNEKQQSEVFKGRIIMILNILTILKKLDDFSKLDTIDKEEADKVVAFRRDLQNIGLQDFEHIKDFIMKFEELLLSIQVSTFNGNVDTKQNLYFPNHPVFAFLSGQTRDYIMMQVSRDTRRDKLVQLTKFKQNIFNEISWNYTLNYRQKIFLINRPITSQFCESIRQYARFCSMIICALLMILVYVDTDMDEMSSEFGFGNIVSKLIVRTLCTIQLVLTIFNCYLWGKMRASLALEKYHQKEEQDTGIYMQPYEQAAEEKSKEGWVNIIEYANLIRTKATTFGSRITHYIKSSTIWKAVIQPILALQETQSGFNSLFLFVAGSLLGYFYGVEWYCLHIFDYFANISLLANVFKAILNNIKILVMFSLLAAAFILVFNILSFRTYTSIIYDEDLPKQSCETILDCVLQLYTSGAIGDDMQTFMPGRFTFDIVYVVFMELLFQNLVSGIMMDAFAQLKDKDATRNQDKEGMCYICAITRSDMEKNGETFNKHLKRHFLWHYVYYIYCLKQKDPTDYTGIQYLIQSQLQNEDISWFPYQGEDDSGGQIQGMIENIDSKIKSIKQRSLGLLEKGTSTIKNGSVTLSKIAKKPASEAGRQ